jgi:nitrate/nitrite transport system ATP-binding protein
MQPYLSIEKLGVTFHRGPIRSEVLRDVCLRVAKGEFISIIGHSGCGKSTLLNVVAGLIKATIGGVILEDHEVDEPGPERAVVFQHHSLLPWLTVYQNVRLAVDKVFRGKSRSERHDWVMHNLALVDIEHAKDKWPQEISGGMKQRVGIARALSLVPKIMLMDEPFSALDALTRGTLQDEVRRICLETGQTVFMITHDVDEAIYLADRVVLMTNGPGAVLAEIVANPLPKERKRDDVHKHPLYYGVRNHIIDFLVSRSKNFAGDMHARGYDRRAVPVVRPGAPEPVVAAEKPKPMTAPSWPGLRPLMTKSER